MGTILVMAILTVIVGLILRSMYRAKQQGRSCSGCSGCSGCRMQGQCASAKNKRKDPTF